MFIIDLNLKPTDLRDPGTIIPLPTYHQAEGKATVCWR
jgi:hypothetical protein